MKLAHESAEHCPVPPAAGLEFLTSSERLERCSQLAKQGYLVARVVQLDDDPSRPDDDATVEPPTFAGHLPRPGQLREAVEGAIEIALALRGAPPAGVEEDPDPCTIALDKIVRAQVVDAPGVCVLMPELATMTEGDGVLGGADSAVLRAWHRLSARYPMVLLLNAQDRGVQALAPRDLASLFDGSALGRLDGDGDEPSLMDHTPTDVSNAVASRPSFEGDESRPEGEEPDGPPPSDETPLEVQHAATLGRLFDALVPDEPDPEPAFFELQLAEDQDEDETAEQELPSEPEPPADDAPAPLPGGLFDLATPEHQPDPQGPPELEEGPARDETPSRSDAPEQDPRSGRKRVRPPRRGGRLWRAGTKSESGGQSGSLDGDTCSRFAQELERAAGPQPMRTIEQLFRSRYMPLIEALGCGLQHEGARQAVTQWRRGFEKTYGEGYTTMRLTGKRPQMVLDAPDQALRIGRLNGARTAQLLLIDSMRYDLGERIMQLFRHGMAGRAVCVDQQLQWAALPAITPTQLRLLARGPRGLREGEPQSERDALVHRGRSVTTLRRVRIGRRDLLKLDVVEARLREAGSGYDERMADLAEEAAAVLVKFAKSLPPRTLLYVFGDHGFRLEASSEHADVAEGTSPAAQGGASPEEVLVPAYAWLVGDVH